MNWTPDQLRSYMTRRLASEQRARERMQNHAKNHNPPQGLPAAEPERPPRGTLDSPKPREEKSGTCLASRFEVRYYVRSRRPMDFDNICIKYLQDLLVEIGALPDDNWQVLQGSIVSDKAESAEEEGTTVVIEQL